MKTHTLSPRTIPLDDSWDIIVAGGGPAGCTAAAAAAREGARTLLLEATFSLGGMGTSGLIPAWCPFSDKQRIIYAGLAQKVFEATKAGMAHVAKDAMDWVPIDAELLKRVYDDLVSEAGVQVLFGTQLCGVEMDGEGRVGALIVANKAGMSALRAPVYVDCTGDADLCAWAGASFDKGEEGTGLMMPTTLCFILSNVDEYGYKAGPSLWGTDPGGFCERAIKSGRYPEIVDRHVCHCVVGPSTVGFNAGHVFDVDGTDPATLSRGIMQGRRLADALRRALAEFAPRGFANAHLVSTASLLGVRETRRIIGDYVLTIQDYIDRRSFADEICRNSYFIDIHMSREELRKQAAGEFNWEERCMHYGPGESHGVPYRCLTPKGLSNVLVAGRSISCDRAVQSSVRVMPACLAVGEAAGMAAAMALKVPERNVHKVNTDALRSRLREAGAYLP